MKGLVKVLKLLACLYGGACGASVILVAGVAWHTGFEPDRFITIMEAWRWPVGVFGIGFGAWAFFRSERRATHA